MIPSRNPLRLYWQMVDHFLRKPGTWRFLGTDWQAECVLPTERRLALRAIITAGLSFKTGKYTMSARVRVEGGTSLAFSRAAQRDLAGVKERLRRRGFRWRDEPLAYYPLSAWKTVTPRSFTGERRFLSELTEQDLNAVERHSPRSLSNLLDAFRGRFSDWRPLHAQWEHRKPIRIAGRPTTAICMFHIAPADTEGRLGVCSSITIWPPWNRKGPLPLWLAKNRAALNSQFRDAGHKAEWHRGPRGRGVMITSMREDLVGMKEIVRERRVFEAARFGDPP
jgi:hypothetical protein